jgi:hypothetical protein
MTECTNHTSTTKRCCTLYNIILLGNHRCVPFTCESHPQLILYIHNNFSVSLDHIQSNITRILGTTYMNRIEYELDRVRMSESESESFASYHRFEPYFAVIAYIA